MYVLHTGRPSIIDGRRISYGDIPCDEGKRTRLAAPTTKAIALQNEDLLEKTAPRKYKPGLILRKWGLAKFLPSNKNAIRNNKDGKVKKDALKSISTDEDGSSTASRKRKMSSHVSYMKNQEVNNIISCNNAKNDKIASFKRAYAAKEEKSELAAKRQRIMCALAKQNIHVEYGSSQVIYPVVSCGNYACTTVPSSALKLRLTKVDDASSRKRKLEC